MSRTLSSVALFLCLAVLARQVPAQSPAAGGTPTPDTAFARMPGVVEFLPVPAAASKVEARDCGGRGYRSDPADLWRRDETARRAVNLLAQWGRQHFRFSGPPSCVDFDFVMRQWQTIVGMPQTGVLAQADADRFQAELLKAQPAFQAATAEWSRRRVAMRAAGIDPNTGGAAVLPRAAASGPAPFVPAGPSGPPENQAFGLSLGAVLIAQRPMCPWRAWGNGTNAHCIYRIRYAGQEANNYGLEFERVISAPDEAREENLGPDPDGLVVISFPVGENPALIQGALRGVLREGRLEGVGFRPRDKDAVLEAFTARYGRATEVPVPMKNTQGASWVGLQYRFRRGEVMATLNCIDFQSASCSYAQILTDRGLEALAMLRRRDSERGVAF